MPSPPTQHPSRFTQSNLSTSERISTNTVGLVALSDFRKRRAEVLEQQEREARDALLTASGASTPKHDTSEAGSRSATPAIEDGATAQRKKVKKGKKALVSFGDDDEEDDGAPVVVRSPNKKAAKHEDGHDDGATHSKSDAPSKDGAKRPPSKVTANASVGMVPRAMTKAALRREATERDTLRKEFLALQEAVKNTEIALPFVFYDGSNTPGGIVRVRKGEFVWVFLDKCRKVGAQRAVGGEKSANPRKEWARIGVDDLMLVRGTMIIPHHYEFYFFILNKTLGPGNMRLFDYSAEAPPAASSLHANADPDAPTPPTPLSLAHGGLVAQKKAEINALEGAKEDPTLTKVVDRRWYERNKHIYPASMWQAFDPEKDYTSEIRRDTGGNTFFFSK